MSDDETVPGRRVGGRKEAAARQTVSPEKTAVLETARVLRAAVSPGPAETRSAAAKGAAGVPSFPGLTAVRPIGEGGMGEVWEAVQVSLGRPVAVKRVRPAFRSSLPASHAKLVEEMFRGEALTTAHLDHPNVVPVHDLVVDATGLPALSMKLVRGRPWDEKIDADFDRLPPAEFLEEHLPVLVDVCQAVAFAHSRGVVHRDVKPSQVMVGEFGEVLLMDWGLAVSVTERPAEATAAAPAPHRSVASSPAGTYAFMAPEQTEASAGRIGPWTDVFLLGATLYFLLTGTCPFDAPTTEEAFARARKGTVEPPELRALERDVPPELSTLCLRAMARRPEDRPASALAFLDELRAFLTGAGKRRESVAIVEDVELRLDRPGPGYRTFSESDAALSRAEGLWRENPAVAPLREKLIDAHARAALAKGDLALAREQAVRLLDAGTRESLLSTVDARDAARRRAHRQRRLLLATTGAALLVLAVGAVKYSLDQRRARLAVAAERDRAERARADAEGLIGFMVGDLRDRLKPVGRLDVLDEAGRRALAYFDALPPDERSPLTLVRRARTLRQLGDVRADRGDLAGAAAVYDQALAVARRAAAAAPGAPESKKEVADAHASLGDARRSAGELDGAVTELSAASALLEETVAAKGAPASWRRDLATVRNRLALAFRAKGDLDSALEQTRMARESLEALVGADPGNDAHLAALAEGCGRLGSALRGRGDLRGAEAEYRRAREILADLAERDPRDSDRALALAVAHSHLVTALAPLGKTDEALSEARAHLAIATELSVRDAANAGWREEVAVGHGSVAGLLLAKGELDGALGESREAETAYRALAAADPANKGLRRDLAGQLVLVGRVELARGERAAAAARAAEALGLVEPLAQGSADVQLKRRLASALILDARVALADGRRARATESFRRAADALAPIAAKSADVSFLAPYAVALALGGRGDEARPVVARLAAAGWNEPLDRALLAGAGLPP